MQDCRDTFLHYLADNLTEVTIHPIRQDSDHPENRVIQMNALNVEFLNSDFSIGISRQYVSLDVTADVERNGIATASSVASLLQTTALIPKKHYAVSGSSVTSSSVGSSIYWNPNAIRFKSVQTDGTYFRFNCLLVLQHHLSDL